MDLELGLTRVAHPPPQRIALGLSEEEAWMPTGDRTTDGSCDNSRHAPVAQLVEPIALSACLEWQAEQAVR
ncbi:MAG: hypothetical protein K8F35_11320, partial [Dokdonella sp.]|nr:hypothetical protein [Dokdonella sp.]